MIPLMDAWISAVAFVIAVAHSGGMPRNAYAATKPEGDSSYAERLGELVNQYHSSGARGGWEWTVHSAPSRASIASPWRKQAA